MTTININTKKQIKRGNDMKIKDMKPQVGIFEIIDNNMFVISREVDYSKMRYTYDDAVEYFHMDLVKAIISSCSKKAQEKYKSVRQGFRAFPRGSVCYNFSNDKYEVYGSRKALNRRNTEIIMRKFNLPRNKTVFYIDSFFETN